MRSFAAGVGRGASRIGYYTVSTRCSIDRSPGFIPCFTESWLWDSRLEAVASHMIRDPWAFRSGLRDEITSVARILTAIALSLLRSCIPHRPEPERLQEQDSSFRSSSAAPLVEVCDSNLYELRKTLQPTSTLTHLCIAFFENEALQYGIIEALETAKSVERSWNWCLGHWQKRREILQTVEKIRNTKCLDRFET